MKAGAEKYASKEQAKKASRYGHVFGFTIRVHCSGFGVLPSAADRKVLICILGEWLMLRRFGLDIYGAYSGFDPIKVVFV